MVSNAAKNAREELHGGTDRFQLFMTLVKGTTRKQAESLRDKVGVAVKASETVRLLHYCEGGHAGQSLCEKLEEKMDERRRILEKITVDTGESETNPKWVINRGRYEAYGDAIATIRGTRLRHEIERSNARLGIE